MVYDVSGDIDLFGGVTGKAMSLVVETYTGRSSKQRGHRALQREPQAQFPLKQERVMALDPVSGHHQINNLQARQATITFRNAPTARRSRSTFGAAQRSKPLRINGLLTEMQVSFAS